MCKKDEVYEMPEDIMSIRSMMKTVTCKARITKIGEDGKTYEVVEEIEFPYFENSETDIKDI